MANDPPASSPLPELADLDPAFDLTTFETERDGAHALAGERTAAEAAPPRVADPPPPLQELPRAGERFPLPEAPEPPLRRPWLTESAIQLAVAAVLAIGAVAIVLLAFRGGSPSAATPTVPAAQGPPAASNEKTTAHAATRPPAAAQATRSAKAEAPGRASKAGTPAGGRRSAGGPVATSGGAARARVATTERSRRAVAPATVPPPPVVRAIEHSTMNVNAVPWANVWIDGRRIGETPLANVRVPIGDHEVIFRHPDLGERRVRAVVEAGVAARVTADMRR